MTRAYSTASMTTGCVPAISRTTTAGRHKASFAHWSTLFSIWEERRKLARLDARALRDLGLSDADVERETQRSFFDVPANRP